jgi:hypothetical protein
MVLSCMCVGCMDKNLFILACKIFYGDLNLICLSIYVCVDLIVMYVWMMLFYFWLCLDDSCLCNLVSI